MWSHKLSRRDMMTSGLVAACSAGLLSGCGEKEAPVLPSGKSRDELEKDIDNPYGVELKKPTKGKSSRRRD